MVSNLLVFTVNQLIGKWVGLLDHKLYNKRKENKNRYLIFLFPCKAQLRRCNTFLIVLYVLLLIVYRTLCLFNGSHSKMFTWLNFVLGFFLFFSLSFDDPWSVVTALVVFGHSSINNVFKFITWWYEHTEYFRKRFNCC